VLVPQVFAQAAALRARARVLRPAAIALHAVFVMRLAPQAARAQRAPLRGSEYRHHLQ